MTYEQTRRRAYGCRGSFSSSGKQTGYGARGFNLAGYQSRVRGRGRGRGRGRDSLKREIGEFKSECAKVSAVDEKSLNYRKTKPGMKLIFLRVAHKESDSETKIEDITKSKLELNYDDDFENVQEKILPATHSYLTLLQNFVSEAPIVKRRKTSHNSHLERSENINSNPNDLSDINDDQQSEEELDVQSIDLSEDDNEDQGITINAPDPFVTHFSDSSIDYEKQKSSFSLDSQYYTQKLGIPELGRVVIIAPKKGPDEFQFHPIADAEKLSLKKKLSTLFLKQRLKLGSLENFLAHFLFNYQDVLFCSRTPTNSEKLRRLVCLHCINHLLKTRDRVIKNNAKIAREAASDDLDVRDQGFTRPKVLFLLPTRESCVRFVKMIVSLYQPEQQENRKRFDDSYATKLENQFENKTDDFRELFGGNNDDMFRLGLKLTRKTIKYFSQFYNSDIILASPLGLMMAIKDKEGKKGDFDFLSSIELVVVDQADALLMQNWEHTEYIFDHMNLQPKEAHGCDFSRVRNFYLDNKAKNYRQTITLAAFNTPEINNLVFNQSKNWAGVVKISASCTGVIQELGIKIKQTFTRLESTCFTLDPDVRFLYFTTVIVPSLTRRIEHIKGILIFIPSYLDFVRVRNYFSMSQATKSLSFGCISEYTSVQDVARSRSHFSTGQQSILIYTERAHHFRRYRIRGVKNVIMYGLPDNPIFYKEIAGEFLSTNVQGNLVSGDRYVRVIFSKWEALKLERVVGSERAVKIMRAKEDTFEFCN